jgi:hypothetical protein
MAIEKNGDWRVFWVDDIDRTIQFVTYTRDEQRTSDCQHFSSFEDAMIFWNRDRDLFNGDEAPTYFATEAEAKASIDPENFKQLEMRFL